MTELSVIIKGVIIELSDIFSLAKKSAALVWKKWLLCVEKVTLSVDKYEIHIKSERFARSLGVLFEFFIVIYILVLILGISQEMGVATGDVFKFKRNHAIFDKRIVRSGIGATL